MGATKTALMDFQQGYLDAARRSAKELFPGHHLSFEAMKALDVESETFITAHWEFLYDANDRCFLFSTLGGYLWASRNGQGRTFERPALGFLGSALFLAAQKIGTAKFRLSPDNAEVDYCG